MPHIQNILALTFIQAHVREVIFLLSGDYKAPFLLVSLFVSVMLSLLTFYLLGQTTMKGKDAVLPV